MTSTIVVKADSKLKAKAQKTAAELGLTLSAVVNGYLKDFVEKKSISFGKNKKKFKDPYGSMPGAEITEKDFKDISDSWMKAINKI